MASAIVLALLCPLAGHSQSKTVPRAWEFGLGGAAMNVTRTTVSNFHQTSGGDYIFNLDEKMLYGGVELYSAVELKKWLYADLQGIASAVHQTGQNVTPQLIRAENMFFGERRENVGKIRFIIRIRCNIRRKKRYDSHKDDDDQSNHSALVFCQAFHNLRKLTGLFPFLILICHNYTSVGTAVFCFFDFFLCWFWYCALIRGSTKA